jgi:transposase
MLDTLHLTPQMLQGLTPQARALIEQMQQRLVRQDAALGTSSRMLAERDQMLAEHQALIARKDSEIALREAQCAKLEFQLARFKRWQLGAKAEAMSAEQRRLFDETRSEDEAELQAQLARLREQAAAAAGKASTPSPRRARREGLPATLRRVEHHHEPDSTTCTQDGCGRTMVRIGEDVTERLDVVPAEFFVHRHVYGKWACRACQTLKQTPSAPEIIDGGLASSGLLAHTLISRYADHLPYYRQEAINARSGVHTPRSTLAAWAGAAGAALQPLYEAHKRFVLDCRVLHADETPVALLDPGAGKTRRAYVWAYARSWHDAQPGVIYDFCRGRGGQYPIEFLAGDERQGIKPWRGTLLTDRYQGYDSVLDPRFHPGRTGAACVAHARRKFDELAKARTSVLADEAIVRLARIYEIEGALVDLSDHERQGQRQALAKPWWDEFKAWLALERRRVVDGGAAAGAIDYTLNHWQALTHHLEDGAVAIDNNHLERQIKPWAMGRKAWMFVGSEQAGQRAATVMSLVQSAKLNGHDPHAYLRDVLQRLPTQLNSRIDDLLPHRWAPSPS